MSEIYNHFVTDGRKSDVVVYYGIFPSILKNLKDFWDPENALHFHDAQKPPSMNGMAYRLRQSCHSSMTNGF